MSAAAISSRAALPARSPMPLMVHSTWRAPPSMPAKELATAIPRSLWQWAERIMSSIPGTRALTRRKIAAYSSGVVVAHRVRDVDGGGPGLDGDGDHLEEE